MNYRVICDQLKTADGEIHLRDSIVTLDGDEEKSALNIRAVELVAQQNPADQAAVDKQKLEELQLQEKQLEAQIAVESGE